MNIYLKILWMVIIAYIVLCIVLFIVQEKLIFYPQKIHKNHQFEFEENFEEINLKTKDQKRLHGVLFKVEAPKGLIFYLHGNGGNVISWAEVSTVYTALNYDVFILDYRGFGKSQGAISTQEQLYEDLQIAYDEMVKRYSEDRIVVIGYSIGTGPASKIAATNNPGLLILEAPYYNFRDLMRRVYPLIPTFILKYTFETNVFLKDCKMPILIFHGERDEVIYYRSSIKLKKFLKETDTVIILDGQQHNNISDNPEYQAEITKLLTSF